MTTFAERQAARDILAESLPSLPVGDACRRWSTCDLCGKTSPEMEFLIEQVGWEDDHAMPLACTYQVPTFEPIDPDLDIWPEHTVWTFTRWLEPAEATVHVHRPRYDPYTSGRTPRAMPRRAA